MRFTAQTKKAIDIAVPAMGIGYVAWRYIGKKDDRDIKYIIFAMLLVGIALYAITSSITKIVLTTALSGLNPADQEKIILANKIDKTNYDKIETIAKTIYGAFHDSSWTEDEDKAIDAINGLNTPDEVKALCQIYSKLFGKSVKAEFDEFTMFADRWANPIKSVVENYWS